MSALRARVQEAVSRLLSEEEGDLSYEERQAIAYQIGADAFDDVQRARAAQGGNADG